MHEFWRALAMAGGGGHVGFGGLVMGVGVAAIAVAAAAVVAIVAVWTALAVDRWFGEPPARWHPVVWMGRYLAVAGRCIAPLAGPAATLARVRPFAGGAAAWCFGALAVGAAAALIERAAWQHLPAWAGAVLVGLMFKPLLAWRMLREEVLAVEAALAVSLDAGRTRLARLVSRDVGALTEAEVRESAIESLAENLNDSVVAPVFWFVLFGLSGAAVYRFANTADAMWGYLGERGGRDWTWAGKWAARADDALSWLPARLTALLLRGAFSLREAPAATAGPEDAAPERAHGLALLRREARRTPSPNSGWPMAAMAIGLGVRLGKPGVYALCEWARPPGAGDVRRAAMAGSRAVVLLLGAGLPVLTIVCSAAFWKLSRWF
jgi:adenosylcobinamide-phosphate synthase